MKKYLIILPLITLLFAPVFAQKAKMNRANLLYEKFNYEEAAQAYLDVLDQKDDSEAKKKIADCYRHLNNAREAEYWYGQVVILPDAEPTAFLYYAMALQANGKCEQAKDYFKRYNTLEPADSRGRLLSLACERTVQNNLLEVGGIYSIKNVETINSAFDDFGPAFYTNGLVFSSERNEGAALRRTFAWTGRPFLDLYGTKVSVVDEQNLDFKYTQPELFHKEIKTKFHDGPVVFTNDKKQIFFTRNNILKGKVGHDENGVIRLKIMSSNVEKDNDFGKATSLPFNSDEYSVCHPALNPDGTQLYFASDMPGGLGGMDLYVSYMENGNWMPPVNLGPAVNTEGNEVFPFMHEDGSLFFASDGQTGLGGLDIFVSQYTNGSWAVPANLGFPINSKNDDFGLILNPEKTYGYFTSDREGGRGLDDIYSFTKLAVMTDVFVFDKRTGLPIQGATVSTGCLNNKTLTTNAKGIASMELAMNKSCDFTAEKAPYNSNTVNSASKGLKAGETFLVQIPLDRDIDLVLNGRTTDAKTGKPLSSATITIESDCGDPSVTLRTDADGSFTYRFRENCCYNIKSSNDKYLTKTAQVCTDKRNESETINVNIPLQPLNISEGVASSFRIENIYYNFDKYDIREDASTGLQEVLKIMQDNPTIIAEIGSFTDARGTTAYNVRLSQRRAESVVRWLVSKGISAQRLVAKGYGESQPANQCADGVRCSEEEHQLNRRTEFRVIGNIYGKTYDQGVRSTKPNYIKTDPCKGCPF